MSKHQIESDVEAFIQILAAWDGASPSFSECVFGAIAHSALLGCGGTLITEIAKEFGAGPSAVVRWAAGGEPMPHLGRSVVGSMAARLRAQADDAARRRKEAHGAFRRMSLDAQAAGEDEAAADDAASDARPFEPSVPENGC